MPSPLLKHIKTLIWVYLGLLFVEGALRKWVFPGQADLILIVRDPVVILIYVLAIGAGVFPFNMFMVAIAGMAAASVAGSLIAGQSNLLVMVYGLRINYLHLPLIWVMASTLNRRDVQRIGSFILLMALPMAVVMVLQFRAPMNAFINRGVGGTEIGQIFGADGRIRPPGLFAFITGPQLFLPLAAAFFLYQAAVKRHLPWLLLIPIGLAIAIMLPVSISRTAMLATGIVGVTFAGTLLFGANRGKTIVRMMIVGVAVCLALSFLPIFSEGRDVFLKRWETAAVSSDGDAWQNVTDRVFGGLLQPFHTMARTPIFGSGIGVGSNVGARLLSGQVGFLLAEDEWNKIILELGPLLGAIFIGFRFFLTCYLALVGIRALLTHGDPLPVLLFAATGVAVFQYQWGPPTILGFAVFGSGLVLASLQPEPVEEAPPEPTDSIAPPVEMLPEAAPLATVHRPASRLKRSVQ